jgi:hypothetical protein
MEEWRDRFEGLVSEATDAWLSRASRLAAGGSYPPFYLYYRPSSSSEYGALYLLPEGAAPDAEWRLGDPEGYPSSLDRIRVRARVHRAAWGLPVLPHAEREREALDVIARRNRDFLKASC